MTHTITATGNAALVAPPGLKNLIVADTRIGSVRGAEGFFHYRRYDALDIARHQTFEAAARLLIDGDLPDMTTEAAFRTEVASARHLDPAIHELLLMIGTRTDSIPDGLMAALPLSIDNTPTLDLDRRQRRAHAIAAIGALPTIVAALHRITNGQQPIVADPSLGHAADYIRMITGTIPAPSVTRAVETYLLLTADHGFNASTFATRVVTSTGAGIAGILSTAVAALSGPLHGGAPSRVLDMLDAIGAPENTEAWARAQLGSGQKLMGFGHAVYRAHDPRSMLLREVALDLGGELVDRAIEIESRMLTLLCEWKPGATIVTNVEFYAAIVLHLAGIPQEMFTPTFASSRVVGWTAHMLEQAADNKIMRPTARYVGEEPRR